VSKWDLCSKAVFLVSKLVFLAITLDTIRKWGNSEIPINAQQRLTEKRLQVKCDVKEHVKKG
jgi:hypothetical protein